MLIVFPFLYALNPLAWWWQDGRYAVYLPVLAALSSIVGIEESLAILRRHQGAVGRRSAAWTARLTMALMAVSAGTLAFVTFLTAPTPIAFTASGWNPNDQSQTDVDLLVHDGVRYGFAGYWVAYRLDFLSGGRLMLSPAEDDNPRDTALYDAVVADRQAAWLFVSQSADAVRQFGIHRLQAADESESVFVDDLTDRGVRYRIIDAGLVEAVVPVGGSRLASATR